MNDDNASSKQFLRVLALDGGGIRGLSSLILLRDLMQRIEQKTNASALLPCEYFDLIIGTGTGGISALFVGRMGLTADEAIHAYLWMAKKGFKRSTLPILPYDGDCLTQVVGDIVHEYLGDRDAKLQDESTDSAATAPRRCRTAVLAATSANASAPPFVFRSYATSHPASTHAIHEVARATISTARLFPPIALGTPPITFLDASVAGYSNPSEIALQEAERLFPGKYISCLVSLGTGRQNIVRVGETEKEIAQVSRRLMEDCEQVHYRLQRKHREGLPYFRFNVMHGLEKIGLMEWNNISSGDMAGITQAIQWRFLIIPFDTREG